MSDENTSTEFQPDLSAAVEAQSQIVTPPQGEATIVDASTPIETQPAAQPWYSQVGFEGVADENAAIEQVRNLRQGYGQTYQQAQYYAHQAQQLQSQLEALRQAQQAQPQPAQPQAAKEPEQPKVPWTPQQLDESYLDWIDPATQTWRENTPHAVVIGYQKQQRALREFQAKLYQNPHELLNPLIEERAKSLVSPLQEELQAIKSQMEQQQYQQQVSALLGPYKNQFFAVDQSGQVQRDQFGNPVLTQDGQLFNHYTTVVQQMGITDPRMQAAFAALALERDQLKAGAAQQVAAQPAQPMQTTRQQQDQAIYANGKANGVNRIANRGNTVNAAAPVAAPKQNEHTSLEDELRQSYRQLVGNGLG